METYPDVHDFFRERLLQALADLEIHTQESTEHYLVNLLSSFAVPERVHELHTPFVDWLTLAYSTRGVERAVHMQGIGDSALFVSGFLSDSMSRRGVTLGYCLTIGQRAYGEAGHLVADPDLLELARRFAAYVRVLDEVREQTAHRTDGEVLQLYERWATTRSPELLRRLGRHGVTALLDDTEA